MMIKSKKLGSRYITLSKQIYYFHQKSPSLVSTDENEMKEIEDTLPFSSLLMFRQVAALEILQEKDEESKNKKSFFGGSKIAITKPVIEKTGKSSDPVTPTRTLSSMFSWGSKPKKEDVGRSISPPPKKSNPIKNEQLDFDDETEDNNLIHELETKFAAIETTSSGDDEFPCRVVLNTSSKLRITSMKQPVAELKMSLTSTTEVRQHKLSLIFGLDNVTIEDTCTLNPVEKYLIRPQNNSKSIKNSNDSNTNQFVIQFDSLSNGDTFLILSAVPMDFTWNALCFQKLFEMFFYTPVMITQAIDNNTITPVIPSNTIKKSKDPAFLTGINPMTMTINIQSPTIIIPRKSTDDNQGYIILDCGNLGLFGQIGTEGINLEIRLVEVNIGMPNKIADRLYIKERNEYIVKPLEISLRLQSYDRSNAELCLEISLIPKVQAKLNSNQVRRLIAVINVITDTIFNAFDTIDTESGFVIDRNRTTTQTIRHQSSMRNSTLLFNENLEINEDLIPCLERKKDLFLSIISNRVEIIAEINSTHFVEILIDQLKVDVITTLTDTSVDIYVDSLLVNDSLRPESQKILIWSPEIPVNTQFFHMSMKFLTSIESQIFHGYGSELKLKFQSLGLNIDDLALKRICPFLNDILRPLEESYNNIPKTILAPELNALKLEFKIHSIILNLIGPTSTSMTNSVTNANANTNILLDKLFSLNIQQFYLKYEFIANAIMELSFDSVVANDIQKKFLVHMYKNRKGLGS